MKLIYRNAIVCVVLSLLVFPILLSADELTDRAQQLIDENNFEEAFQILFAEIEDRAGTPDYDLLLGIAAMDSGHPTQAVFAFERVLAIEPDNSRARLELARAYFELGRMRHQEKNLPIPKVRKFRRVSGLPLKNI